MCLKRKKKKGEREGEEILNIKNPELLIFTTKTNLKRELNQQIGHYYSLTKLKF